METEEIETERQVEISEMAIGSPDWIRYAPTRALAEFSATNTVEIVRLLTAINEGVAPLVSKLKPFLATMGIG